MPGRTATVLCCGVFGVAGIGALFSPGRAFGMKSARTRVAEVTPR